MGKALSVDVGPDGQRVVRMLSGNPTSVWDAMAEKYKYMAYLEFGPNDLADVVGEERVKELEVTMAIRGDLPARDRAKTLIANPRRSISQVVNSRIKIDDT